MRLPNTGQCWALIAGPDVGPAIRCTLKDEHTGPHHHRADRAGSTDRGYALPCPAQPLGHPAARCTLTAGHDGFHPWSDDVPLTAPVGHFDDRTPSSERIGLRRLHLAHNGPTPVERLDLDLVLPAGDVEPWYQLAVQLGYRFTMRPV